MTFITSYDKPAVTGEQSLQPLHSRQLQHKPTDDPTALKLAELLEKFLLLKKVTQATAIAYKNCIEEISKFKKSGDYAHHR